MNDCTYICLKKTLLVFISFWKNSYLLLGVCIYLTAYPTQLMLLKCELPMSLIKKKKRKKSQLRIIQQILPDSSAVELVEDQ